LTVSRLEYWVLVIWLSLDRPEVAVLREDVVYVLPQMFYAQKQLLL